MLGFLNILSTFLHNFKPNNLKILFDNNIDIETTDHNIFNKYIIHKFNQYIAINAKNYSFWNCIQIDFEKSEKKYFDKFYDSI